MRSSRMTKSVLTTAQWRWVGDRWLEGYTMSELADFLGLHRETVRRGLVRLGIRPYEKSELTPLSEREAEYKNIKEYTELNDASEQVGYSREDAADCIRYMDAADVAPVRHGYWRPILHKDGKTDYECSCCLGIIMDVPDDDEHDLCAWCSMCGAKMDLK